MIDILRNIPVCKGQLRTQFCELLKRLPRNVNNMKLCCLRSSKSETMYCDIYGSIAYCTAPLRQGETTLLFSKRVPHSHCLTDTVRSWTKRVMKEAGIDLEIFTPHSTWAASTSKVAWKIPLKTTLQTTEYLCHGLPQTSVEEDWFSPLQCYSKIGTGN